MSGIFISYRRVDTIAWAGRLFADLTKRFGESQVFMDINRGIPRGADFEKTLTDALAGCDALVALIGPQWSTCVDDQGRRRLDSRQDWVCNEIITALGRNITTVPVLLGDAKLPKESEIPSELHPFLKRNYAEISDSRWDYDVGELIKDLVKLASLKLLPGDDVASADAGIRLLRDLMFKVPSVSDAVSRSKEVIQSTYRQVDKLELFKTLHDSLHTVEFECLRPLEEGGLTNRLRPFKVKFISEAGQMRKTIDGRDVNPSLRDDLVDQLEITEQVFQMAMDEPGEAGYRKVVGALTVLLSSLVNRLDLGISDAAAELNLDRLVELMMRVRGSLTTVASVDDKELTPFMEGADALTRLRDELSGKVAEHTQLQRLDSKLRAVCVAGTAPTAISAEWERIKLIRARLTPPYSPELSAAAEDLREIEKDVNTAVTKNENQAALELLQEYFRAVSSVFRDVDRSLKGFCLHLSEVNQPLKTVLNML